MKKKLLVSIGAAVLIFSMGTAPAFGMGHMPEDRFDRQSGFRRDLTDEDKARMETERLRREEKLQAFIGSLSNEQKALYEELFSRQGFGNGMFGMRGDKPEGMPDRPEGDKTQMDAARSQHHEKLNAFIESLNSEQKALYDAMMPARMEKPAEGQRPVKPDENFMSSMKEKQEAFVASLSESQKAVFDELFGEFGRMFGRPGHHSTDPAQTLPPA